MNVVDSSAWLEYFEDGPNATDFAVPIEATADLVVPVLTLFEVFKRVHQLKGESTALDVIGIMLQGKVVDLTPNLALDAARLSLNSGLPMADAIILATARAEDAVLWTQDAHFERFDKVEFRAKKG